MAGKLVKEFKEQFIVQIRDDLSGDWAFGLFRNDVAITNTTVLADLTEANYGGYGAVGWGSWGDPYELVDTHEAIDRAANVVFAGDGSGPLNTVYGWYLWDNGTGRLIWAQRLPNPKTMLNTGDVIELELTAVFGQLPL